MFPACRPKFLSELPVLSACVQIVTHLPPVDLTQIISKYPLTVPMNAGDDIHTINCIGEQCFGLIAAGNIGLEGTLG